MYLLNTMEYIYRTNLFFFLVAFGIALVLAGRVWPLRNRPHGRIFILLMAVLSGWFLLVFIQGASLYPAIKIASLKLSYLFSGGASVLWIIFIIVFIEKEKILNKDIVIISSIVPFITNILVWTNNAHRLMWKSIEIDSGYFPPFILENFGTWYWVNMAYDAFIVFLGIVALIVYLHYKGLYQSRNKLLLYCGLIVLMGHLLYVVRLKFFEYLNPIPVTFALAGIVLFIAIIRYRLFDFMPIAYMEIFRNINTGIIVLNVNDIILDANPYIERITGKKVKEMLDRPLIEIFPELKLGGAELFSKNGETKNLRERQELLVEETHFQRCFEVSISPIFNPKPIGKLVIFHDVTDRKKAEEEALARLRLQVEIETLEKANELLEEKVKERTKQLEEALNIAEKANRAKSEFLASMSHELRTPLTAIIGFSQVLQEEYFGKLNDKQQDYVKDIIDSGMHLLSLINDILDISRIEAGQISLNLEKVEVENLVQECVELFSEQANRKSITLKAVFEGVHDIKVALDSRRIKQVIFNLLANAIKFTHAGGEVKVEVKRNMSEIMVSVTDTGIGIEMEEQKKIFEPFYQVKNSLSGKTPGTGLGLSICKNIIEQHKGKVWVESEGLNKGSRFIFTVPIEI